MKIIKKYLLLFWNTLFISTFTFGGGYVIISMYRKKYVEQLKLLSDEEMMDIMTLSQSSPGPIAVNSSLLIGYKLGGFFGGIMSLLGTITPPIVILTVVSMLYSQVSDNQVLMSIMHGMQAGITAIICDVIVSLTIVVKKEKNYYGIITLPLTFALVFFLKINVLFIILPAFAFGIIVTLIEKKIALIKANKADNANNFALNKCKKYRKNRRNKTLNPKLSDNEEKTTAVDAENNSLDCDVENISNISEGIAVHGIEDNQPNNEVSGDSDTDSQDGEEK